MSVSNSSGYPKLASFMVQEGYAIYRQFQELACQDLLYRQSELVHLERELQIIAKHDRDAGRDTEEKQYGLDWRKLSTSATRNSPSKQWMKALEVREKLQQYYAAFLQYKQIFSEKHPSEKEVQLLRDWISRPSLGGGCEFFGLDLGPRHRSVYDDELQDDLMSVLDRGVGDDGLSRLLTDHMFYAFDWILRRLKRPKPADLEGQASSQLPSNHLIHYSDKRLVWTVDFFGTVLASLTPMSGIIVLYYIQNMSARLGAVCAFTIIFAAVVKFATRARRVELFAITAAFCSVQVVFVGSTAHTCIWKQGAVAPA